MFPSEEAAASHAAALTEKAIQANNERYGLTWNEDIHAAVDASAASRRLQISPSFTSGQRRVLALRVKFADQADSYAVNPTSATTILAEMKDIYERRSLGKLIFSNITVSPCLYILSGVVSDPPEPNSYYK